MLNIKLITKTKLVVVRQDNILSNILSVASFEKQIYHLKNSKRHSSNNRKVNDKLETTSAKKKKNSSSSSTKGTIKSNFELYVPVFQNLNPYLSKEEIEGFINTTVDAHNHLVKTTGIAQATRSWKAITNYCIQLVEGRNPERLHRVSTGKIDGWPTLLSELRPLYHRIKDKEKLSLSQEEVAETIRLLRTLFKLNRVCYDYIDLDVAGLGQKFDISKETEKEFEEFLTAKYPTPLLTDPATLNINPLGGQANGPNRLPKRETAVIEAYAIVNSRYWHKFREYCILTDNKQFLEYIEHLATKYDPKEDLPLDKVVLRKLTAIPDKGNKSRTIAMCDIFTQMLLNSLEQFIIGVTNRNFPDNNAFFSHKEGFNKIKNLPHKIQEELVSLDAEAWTDNLPSRLQFINLKVKCGLQLALAWQNLAVTCDWNIGNSDKTIKYGKGQGMGTKGSFVIAQDTNLEFIEFILVKEYPDKFTADNRPFFIEVGDDMVIQDPEMLVSEHFESIGVPINLSKSKYSVKGISHIEFTSRNITDGYDTSIISPSLISRARRQHFLIPTLVSHLNERANDRTFNFINFIKEIIGDKPEQIEKISLFTGIHELCSDHSTINVDYDTLPQDICMQEFSRAMIYEVGSHFKKFLEDDGFRDLNIGAAKADLLKTQYSLYEGEGRDIWTFSTERDLDINQIEFLYIGTNIRKITEDKYSKGSRYEAGEYLIPDVDGMLMTSVNLVTKVLEIQLAQMQSFMRLKSVARLSGLDEGSNTSSVHLFKFMNSVLTRTKKGYPDESEILPYLEHLQLNQTYLGLLKLKRLAARFHITVKHFSQIRDESTSVNGSDSIVPNHQ